MNGNHTWKDAVIDSALAGAAAGLSVLSGLAFAGVRTDAGGVAYVVVVAFLSAFVMTLQAARGRAVKKVTPPKGGSPPGG